MLPRFSGERLDLIVDYLTYVVVPAFALIQSDLLPEPFRLPAAIAILLSSLFHVADVESKTKEGYFVGFPAIWNIVLLYLFALRAHRPMSHSPSLRLFVALTFVPILCVHPFRVARLRPLTCARRRCFGSVPPPSRSPILSRRRSGSRCCSSLTAAYLPASVLRALLPTDEIFLEPGTGAPWTSLSA